jgi:hypothetical protein
MREQEQARRLWMIGLNAVAFLGGTMIVAHRRDCALVDRRDVVARA